MKEYEFTIHLIDAVFDEATADKLCKAGCDDALFYADSDGVHLDFIRLGDSKRRAAQHALVDLWLAGFIGIADEKNT